MAVQFNWLLWDSATRSRCHDTVEAIIDFIDRADGVGIVLELFVLHRFGQVFAKFIGLFMLAKLEMAHREESLVAWMRATETEFFRR